MRRRWVLVARVAAGKFCRRKTRASRWTPALLRWARRSERLRAGTSRHTHTHTQWHSHTRVQTQTSVGSWTTRLHLHFHLVTHFGDSRTHQSVRVLPASRASQVSRTPDAGASPHTDARSLPSARRFARTSPRTPARMSALTTWRTLPSTVVRSGEISWSALHSNPASRENGAAFVPVARAATRSMQFQKARPSTRTSLRTSTRPSARSSTRLLSRPSARPLQKEIEQVLAPVSRHEPVKQRWRARRESASNPTPESASAPARSLPAWATKSPVDSVWRAPPDKTSASVARATNSQESSHTSAVTSAIHTPPASKPTERAAVCATALDPGLADRLAADVIRRIDRRARIERERKGM